MPIPQLLWDLTQSLDALSQSRRGMLSGMFSTSRVLRGCTPSCQASRPVCLRRRLSTRRRKECPQMTTQHLHLPHPYAPTRHCSTSSNYSSRGTTPQGVTRALRSRSPTPCSTLASLSQPSPALPTSPTVVGTSHGASLRGGTWSRRRATFLLAGQSRSTTSRPSSRRLPRGRDSGLF